MSCIITDACSHCRTIFVCKGHCHYDLRHTQQQAGCSRRSDCTERSDCLGRGERFERHACFERNSCYERVGCIEQTDCSSRGGCAERDQAAFPRQQSEMKQHPTPFGIRNILGLGETDKASKNDDRRQRLHNGTAISILALSRLHCLFAVPSNHNVGL